jgi:hypothetical protein
MIPHDIPPADRRSPRKWLICCAIVVLLSFILLLFAPLRQTRSRIDTVSGTMEWQTTWPLGITAGPRIDASPLEMRLREMGVQWKREWDFLHNTHRTLFGDAIMFECGSAPPMYYLRPMLGDFLDICTEEEIREFARLMQSADKGEVTFAVQAAKKRVFDANADLRSGQLP